MTSITQNGVQARYHRVQRYQARYHRVQRYQAMYHRVQRYQARYHRVQRYLSPDGLQVSVQETEALCQRDSGDGDEQVHEVPGERGHNLGHGGQGCTCVGVANVLEQMVVTPQHVPEKNTAVGVGLLRCQLHVGVLAEQVFNCNSVIVMNGGQRNGTNAQIWGK